MDAANKICGPNPKNSFSYKPYLTELVLSAVWVLCSKLFRFRRRKIFSEMFGKGDSSDDLFSGRGSPALLSLKEPALRILRDRYSETFAITMSREKKQVHLFIIKFSLWALVRTFVPKDVSSDEISVSDVLTLLENALKGSESGQFLLSSLDSSVERARARLDAKASEYHVKS